MLIVQNLLAFALGPLLIGRVSDALHPVYGEDALATMLAAPLAAGCCCGSRGDGLRRGDVHAIRRRCASTASTSTF